MYEAYAFQEDLKMRNWARAFILFILFYHVLRLGRLALDRVRLD